MHRTPLFWQLWYLLQAMPSHFGFVVLAAGNALLLSGICDSRRRQCFLLSGICDTRCRQMLFSFLALQHSLQAMLFSFLPFVAFGTGEGLLRYGIRIRCSKQAPGVRDAFSEAFGAKNRRFRYGRDIRCAEQPPVVRDASWIFGTAPLSGTEQDSLNRKRVSLALLRN